VRLAQWAEVLGDDAWRDARELEVAHVSLRPSLPPPPPSRGDLTAPPGERTGLPYVLLASPEGVGALATKRTAAVAKDNTESASDARAQGTAER
jgi:hypothetical protein